MKIFDLHNDALTAGGKTNEDVIYAIWTTRLSYGKTLCIIDNNRKKMLAIEDCKAFYNHISDLAKYNFMYVGLTWNGFNGFAGGAKSHEHLTKRGRRAIDLLNNSNMVLDTAHLNRESFFEATDIANKIICSHTCFYDVNKHPRNLTREQISVIINKGGIVGLCFVNEFLGGNTIDAVLNHVDWFLDNFGDKSLSIGSDFYGSTDLPVDLKSYGNFDKLVLAMIRRGYSDATIHNILYANAAAYFFP